MTMRFTLRDAKARLSEILDAVAAGEDVEILRKGGRNDRFRIVLLEASGTVRRPGALKGRIRIPEDFDAEDPDLVAAFEGGP